MSAKSQPSSIRLPREAKNNAVRSNTESALLAKYQAILRAPRWEPRAHSRMTRQARAAQFSPFAALTGFYDEIEAKRTELAQRRDAEIIQEGETWPGDDLEEVDDSLVMLETSPDNLAAQDDSEVQSDSLENL